MDVSARRSAAVLTALAFAICWGMIGIVWLLGWTTSPWARLLGVVYMWIPGLLAIWMTRKASPETWTTVLGLPMHVNRWWLVAWGIPPVILLGTVLVGMAWPGVVWDPRAGLWIEEIRAALPPEKSAEIVQTLRARPLRILALSVLGGLVAGPTINALVALGEELAWRGALYRWLRPLGFWRSAGLIGVIWGIWHWPMVLLGLNYPEHRVLGIVWMIVFTVLLAPVIQWVRERGHSIWPAAIFHGTLNGLGGIPWMVLRGADDRVIGIAGVTGWIALGIADMVLWVSMRRGFMHARGPYDSSVPRSGDR